MWYFIGAYCFFSLQKHRKTFHYNICKCTSILSNTQCVQFGIMCLWKTDFCSYLCCVLFFPHLFIYCVYGSHPFLRPLIYSYVHTLDTFNYLEILFFLLLSFGISSKCRYWICVDWAPHEAGLKWLRGVHSVHNHQRIRHEDRHWMGHDGNFILWCRALIVISHLLVWPLQTLRRLDSFWKRCFVSSFFLLFI